MSPAKKPLKKKQSGAKKKPAPAPKKPKRTGAAEVHARLQATLPSPKCELDFHTPWQLVIATILSAQATDKLINRVTPVLFARWPTPRALADAAQEEVEEVVRSTGYFRNKAKAIRAASQVVADRFGGEVPKTMEEITELPGVARKTGNLVLGTAYRITTGIIVDTHAGRVARRLGLTTEEDPVDVEQDLCAAFPREAWIDTGHRLVLHGRYLCTAKAPRCASCPLAELCPSREAKGEGSWEARADAERRLVEARGELDANPRVG